MHFVYCGVDRRVDGPFASVLGFCIARLTVFGGLVLHLVYMDLHYLDDRLILMCMICWFVRW